LSAFTIRLFDPQTSDADLDELFEEALTERPAIIVLEDLDRAFPRTGETKTQVSIQNLLNCLDGVASGEGTITIATANEPTALDPAILRRPGRFDRVVHFPNPSREMRLRYFLHMNPHLAPAAIQQTIADSSGLSFAQLREAAVLASQFAFERSDDVTATDLLRGVHTLRETIVQSSAHSNSAGFTSVTQDGLAV
jgi:SpoVK/Ycf46/Vps4 family AAA+-type ATPase